MSESESAAAKQMESLERDDQVWLADCLEQYRDLLTYLQDH